MADSTGTPGDEERQSLLRNSNSIDSQHKKRDQLAIEAVAGINQIVDTAGAALLIALLLVFINQFVDEVIPSWSIFLVLWLGHAVIVLICGSSVRLLLLSIVSKNDRERVSQKWHQANERRIPLLQFAMYHILWIFGLSIALVIFEILLYLALSSQIPTYSIFIVPYILLGIAISNSFVCRFVFPPLLLLFFLGIKLQNLLCVGQHPLPWPSPGYVFSPSAAWPTSIYQTLTTTCLGFGFSAQSMPLFCCGSSLSCTAC